MLTYFFFTLATIFNCLMDIMAYTMDRSVFQKWNRNWWDPYFSWMYVKPFLGWMRFDGWHLLKFGMLFSFVASICTGPGIWWVYLLIWGVVWEILWRVLKQPSNLP